MGNYINEKLSEQFVHYLWFEQLFIRDIIRCQSGEKTSILFPGIYNRSDGPDFVNAEIILGNALLQGGVELHLYSSDWYKHKHHQNPKYSDIILHVSLFHNIDEQYVTSLNNRKIKQLTLLDYLDRPISDLLSNINNKNNFLSEIDPGRCAALYKYPKKFSSIQHVISNASGSWLSNKINKIQKSIAASSVNDAFFEFLLEAMGYINNRKAFRQLAKALPYSKLAYILENEGTTSAQLIEYLLLFAGGLQSNLNIRLMNIMALKYFKSLLKYKGIETKYNIKQENIVWHFGGTVPVNSPYRRIAGISAYISKHFKRDALQFYLSCFRYLFENKPLNDDNVPEFEQIIQNDFNQLYNEFWNIRYCFHSSLNSVSFSALFGENKVRIVTVNVILPFIIALAQKSENEILVDKGVKVFRSINAYEDNAISRYMKSKLFGPAEYNEKNITKSYQIQGLMQLYYDFCSRGMASCSRCVIPSMLKLI